MITLVFLAACGSASADRPPTSTTSTTFVAALPDLPTDPEGARCQAVVNALVAEWQPLGRVEAEVRCLPAIDGENGHYQPLTRSAVVGYAVGVGEAFYRGVAAHELGHAWDEWGLDAADRRRYTKIRGLVQDWSLVGEDYADVFAIAGGHPTVFPSKPALLAPVTPDLIETLRAEGLLPG